MATESNNPEHLHSVLHAADFFMAAAQNTLPSAQDTAAPQVRPEVPQADPKTQEKLEHDLKHALSPNLVRNFLLGNRVHEASGKTSEELRNITDEIYAKIPDAIPEAKKLPPKPKLYTLNDNDSFVFSYYEGHPSQDATAIIGTKIVLNGLSSEEKKSLICP